MISSNSFAPYIDGGGLILNVTGGSAQLNGGNIVILRSTVVALTANTTNYVYLDLSLGTISDTTGGFPAGAWPIAIVTTSSKDITQLTDSRVDISGASGNQVNCLPLSGGTLTGVLQFNKWNGTFEQVHDDDGIVTWNRVGGSFANGFSDPRKNQVFRMGWNIANGGGPLVPGEPCVGVEMEDYFVAAVGQVGTGQMEYHNMYVDSSASVHRVWSWTADRATNFIDLSISSSKLSIIRDADNQQVVVYTYNGTYPTINHNLGAILAGVSTAPAQTWSINSQTGTVVFTGSLTVGTAGATSSLEIDGLSSQGPDLIRCTNEAGVKFEVAANGSVTIYNDGNAQGNTWIFGTGQSMRLQNGTVYQNSVGVIGWTLDSHAYDAVDTSLSRSAAGVVAIGTGTQGSVAGTLACATVKFSTALIALGGGATPTLGTIGGSGPATAGQNTWLLLKDSGGNSFWVPAWK